MIKVYYLETEVDMATNTEKVKGIDYIYHALNEVEGTLRKVIQDTTIEEDNILSSLARETRKPTIDELARFNSFISEIQALEPVRDLAAEIDALKTRIEKLEKIK